MCRTCNIYAQKPKIEHEIINLMMMACLLLDEDDVNKETMNMSIPSNPRAEEDVELPSGLKVESHSPGGLC